MIKNKIKVFDVFGIFGGTFNPIHYGHLNIINKVIKMIRFKQIIFLPNYKPWYRCINIIENIEHRIKMIQLGIKNFNPYVDKNFFKIVFHKHYSIIETLFFYRKKYGFNQSLIFILGSDSLESINKWIEWECILNFCHLFVFPRYKKKYDFNQEIKCWIKKNQIFDINIFYFLPFGKIYLYDKKTLCNISSTEIRNLKIQNQNYYYKIPYSIFCYIRKNELFIKK
ncbi:MAG: nicotinate (nicotinamide) nucleotide adenylyltransferase [Arsenophonus sp.]|nr:MAG: nicotinate (nicotinamide) nucleotide adenylyltransferase [Arsenophonus sp.]